MLKIMKQAKNITSEAGKWGCTTVAPLLYVSQVAEAIKWEFIFHVS